MMFEIFDRIYMKFEKIIMWFDLGIIKKKKIRRKVYKNCIRITV